MGEPIAPAAEDKLQDLSGIVLQPGENPYNALINACNDDHREIQALYTAHRVKRNAQQKDKFLSPDFNGLSIDQHLLRLERPHIEPGYKDPRHCITLWSRPTDRLIQLAVHLQHLLKAKAPDVWLMPAWRMHLTTLEVTHSKTAEEVEKLVTLLRPSLPSIVNYTHNHRSRLVKPMISYDLSAFALSFLPAAGEPKLSPAPVAPDTATDVVEGDEFTYHHVRREIFDKVRASGIEVESRYQVPSAHITLGRYLSNVDHDTPEKRKAWVEAIDEINEWLEKEVWDQADAEFLGEWMVGQERGIENRCGTLWYGVGRQIMQGEGY